MRSHFHPSTADWSIPAPLMSPVEVLHLFVHRLRAHDPARLLSTPAVPADTPQVASARTAARHGRHDRPAPAWALHQPERQ